MQLETVDPEAHRQIRHVNERKSRLTSTKKAHQRRVKDAIEAAVAAAARVQIHLEAERKSQEDKESTQKCFSFIKKYELKFT